MKKRRMTEVMLADGNVYTFAELPVSMAIMSRLARAMEGDNEMDAETVRSMDTAMRVSLKLGGNEPAVVDELMFLIDFEDKEVIAPVMDAVFPEALRGARKAVAAAAGAGGSAVGPDTGGSGGAG